jgi:hypothetical protein
MTRLLMVAALVIAVAHVASAQSLGDVAKKEEQRRKTTKPAAKVYTNDTLKPDPTPSVPATSATGTTPAATSPAPAAPAPSDDSADKGDEKTWRKKIADARDALQRSQAFADALQSQLNGLTTDFVNRDDPAQRQLIANKRDAALAELERVKKEVAAQNKAISDIQEQARRAGVPAGWVR